MQDANKYVDRRMPGTNISVRTATVAVDIKNCLSVKQNKRKKKREKQSLN